jgi:hypothetical protein
VTFDPPPTISIHFGREHASQLTLPVIGDWVPEARRE